MAGPIAILGCGPSLTREQVKECYGRGLIMAIKQAHKLAPGAHWLHGNPAYWQQFPEAADFVGVKSTSPSDKPYDVPDSVTRFDVDLGIPFKDYGSGYEGIYLAVAMGFSPIVLLGFDHKRNGHFDGWVMPPNVKDIKASYIEPSVEFHVKLCQIARMRGQVIHNATPGTELRAYPQIELPAAFMR